MEYNYAGPGGVRVPSMSRLSVVTYERTRYICVHCLYLQRTPFMFIPLCMVVRCCCSRLFSTYQQCEQVTTLLIVFSIAVFWSSRVLDDFGCNWYPCEFVW